MSKIMKIIGERERKKNKKQTKTERSKGVAQAIVKM